MATAASVPAPFSRVPECRDSCQFFKSSMHIQRGRSGGGAALLMNLSRGVEGLLDSHGQSIHPPCFERPREHAFPSNHPGITITIIITISQGRRQVQRISKARSRNGGGGRRSV